MTYLMRYQPIMKGQKIHGNGPKGSNLPSHLTSFLDQETSDEHFFVNIQTATPIVNDFLRGSFLSSLQRTARCKEFTRRAPFRGNNLGCLETSRSNLVRALWHQFKAELMPRRLTSESVTCMNFHGSWVTDPS
jgi:hypothetical protein